MPNTTQGMNWIRKEKRIRIYERDGWTCAWCGRALVIDVDSGERTLDHVLSRAAGGSNDANNLVMACRTCNTERGDTCAIDYAFGALFARTGRKPWLVLNDLIERVCRELPAKPAKQCAALIPAPGGRLRCMRDSGHALLHCTAGGLLFGDK